VGREKGGHGMRDGKRVIREKEEGEEDINSF